MKTLSLKLFGNVRLLLDEQPVIDLPTKKAQALLLYLAAGQSEEHRRESLMTMLWPGILERSARHSLRQTLYYLRQKLPEVAARSGKMGDEAIESVPLLLTNRQVIALHPEADVEVDVTKFETLLAGTQAHAHVDLSSCHDCRNDLNEALEIYQGDFLTDFYLDDSNEFENWAQAKREYYRRRALDALEILTTVATRQREFGQAQAYAERQLATDNLRESAYRQLMEILALSGRREEALALYKSCRRLFAEELGMEPAARTTEIFKKILAGHLSFESPLAQEVRGYELKEEIGRGAFGAIHRAIQPGIGREVAVKVIRRRYANDPQFIRRFEAEAQTIARLEHPFIVPLYDYWRDPDGAYLVMRLLHGGSLLSVLKSGPWEPDLTLKMLDQIGGALSTAHQHGVIHRDLKPANILLDKAGNAYLSDFGIAMRVDGNSGLAGQGADVSTLDYISPEQILNEQLGPQADVYSLGAVLYETLTGEKPFPDTTAANLLYKHLNEPVPLVTDSRPDLPSHIDDVIQRATAKRPADRYASALELAQAFREAGSGLGPGLVALPTPVPEVSELYNPYKGLRAFQETDADDFFGREALIERLANRLAASRFLALVGPSGSGKSSVVKAGLIPTLRQNALPSGSGQSSSDKWFVAEMVPGTHPLEELEVALWRIAVDPPPSLVEPMQRDTRGLLRTIRRILPDEEGAQLLLVIDQFEELFTLVEDDERRSFFVDSLLVAIRAPRSPLRVVITLRADFYDRPLEYEFLGALVKQNTEVILPLTSEEMTWAVREPARRMGVGLEQGLAEAIVADVSDQPGSLPLLQYALTELFEKREGKGRYNLMTRDAYEEIGGISGALGRRAEEIFASLDEYGQETTRQLFLRLVTLGEGVEDTRRRVLRSELEAIEEERSINNSYQLAVNDRHQVTPVVLDTYGAARLLTFDHDPLTRGPTVEVAHEALLRRWERLRRWLDESRNDVRLQRLLAGAAAEWKVAQHDDGYLLRGSRLEQFAGWAESSSITLTQDERTFLKASIDAREARMAEEEARRQRELETAQKLVETERARAEEQSQAAGRLQRRAVYLGVALVAAVLLAVVAIFLAQQSSRNATVAEENADLASTREAEALIESEQRATAQAQAEEQTQLAFSRELAAAAQNDLDSDPERSILLALEALSAAHTLQAENVLHEAVLTSRLRQTFIVGTELWGIDFRPDGRQVVTGDKSGRITFWDTATGEVVSVVEGHEGYVNGIAYNKAGTLLATAGDDNAKVWDVATGQELFTMDGHTNWVYSIAFSPDSKYLATSSSDTIAKIWDVEASLAAGSGQELHTLSGHTDWLWNINFSPDGRFVGTASSDGTAKIWDVASGEEQLSLQVFELPGIEVYVESTLFSADGRRIVTVGGDSTGGDMSVWDITSGQRLYQYVGHTTVIQNARVSPDGSLLATAGGEGTAKVWDLSGNSRQALITLSGHTNWVNDLAFGPDGRYLVTASRDGTARLWDISPSGNEELLTLSGHTEELSSVIFSPDGKRLATSSGDKTARVWDSSSGQILLTLSGHEARVNDVAFSPDGTRLATAGEDNVARLWDAATGQELLVLSGHTERSYEWNWNGIIDLAFSPDGTRLATAGVDGQVKVWNVESGQETLSLTGHPDNKGFLSVAYSQEGKLLAAGTDQPSLVKVWDAGTGEEMFTLPGFEAGRIWALAFNPADNQLAIGNNTGALVVWQLPGENSVLSEQSPHELLSIPSAHSTGMWDLNYSEDGTRFVTSAGDGTFTVWDAATGQPLITLSHSLAPRGADFSPDGSRLAVAFADGFARVYTVDLDELKALAQSRVTRSLTEEECQEYLHMESCPAG